MLSISETKTEYNPQAKQWIVYPSELTETEALTAGKIIIFPAGQEGKRAALLSALTADAPAVAAEVEHVINWALKMNQPELINRALRAGFILTKGQLYEPHRLHKEGAYLGEVARVQSDQDPAVFYAIAHRPSPGGSMGRWHCECHDFKDGIKRHCLKEGNPDRPATGAPFVKGHGLFCKHTLAVHIALKVNDFKFKKLQEN